MSLNLTNINELMCKKLYPKNVDKIENKLKIAQFEPLFDFI